MIPALTFCLLYAMAQPLGGAEDQEAIVVVGSKSFSESRLLGEIFAVILESRGGTRVERRFGLGGTKICFEAMRQGSIDMYPEYTGTALNVLLGNDPFNGPPDSLYGYVRKRLSEEHQLTAGPPMGFNNTYALAVRTDFPISNISALADVPDTLSIGCSHEFLERRDGYHALADFYGLKFTDVTGMEHGLTYPAIVARSIDLTDVYVTDGRIAAYDLKLLRDDRAFFPPYRAVPLVRSEALRRHPAIADLLAQLEGLLDDNTMRQLNYMVEVEGRPLHRVAVDFLAGEGIIAGEEKADTSRWSLIAIKTVEHLLLTFSATLLAIIAGVPAGFFITRSRRAAGIVLTATSVLQTIPSLALLGFMIPLMGIGVRPAIAALFLYALLPIIRNTYAGILSVDKALVDAGKSMGMTRNQVLFQIELPLSVRTIMAGIRTATVINIGTATLAAFIGAGGLGELIITGISLNNNTMILEGAMPAALLAIGLDLLLLQTEKRLTPPGDVRHGQKAL